MKILLCFPAVVLMLVSCAAPVANEKPPSEARGIRCQGCGRAIQRPQDMRGEMCSMCDWRLGANIGWP